jgi:hypothetical protein
MARDSMVDIKTLSRKKDKFMFAQKEMVPDQRTVAKMIYWEWLIENGTY